MLAKALASASASAAKVYIEDVFSTWLYTGNNSTQTITNGIDLSGKGGMVWIKSRDFNNTHHLFDTTRGATKYQRTNSTDPQVTDTTTLTAFSSSGFTLSYSGQVNGTSNYVSWTFREAPKFFDVVSWTGDGASSRTISHSLGSTPGFIIIKSVDYSPANWQCWHRSISTGTLSGNDLFKLNSTDAANSVPFIIGSVSSTTFEIGSDSSVNQNFFSYVAYVFAHDAGGFGDSGNESVIKCGSFTTGSNGFNEVSLGWEPQWILFKNTNAQSWYIWDTMRGMALTSSVSLSPNLSGAEIIWGSSSYVYPTANGFAGSGNFFGNGVSVIYIAIRRGPMKTPTDATKVFGLNARTGTGANATVTGGQVADAALIKNRGSAVGDLFAARLTGTGYLETSSTAAEVAAGTTILQANPWDVMDGVKVGTTSTITNASANTFINYLFRRAPGFFDIVCYTGTGSNLAVTHNLAVAPELIIWKTRNVGSNWIVGFDFTSTTSKVINLDTTGSSTTRTYPTGEVSTKPTATTVTMGNSNTRQSGDNYIMYLFASLTGISKVGSYTGTGTTLSVDCGFTNGARFVLIKRTDSTGDWYVWDTARGIVSGNDPYLLLNSTAAEVTNTDYIDPLSSGFQISSTAPAAINANGGSYIYLAIA